MDLSSLIIGGIICLAIILFFYFNYRKRVAHEKELINSLHHAAEEYKIQIAEGDVWRNKYAIGLDPFRKAVIFLSKELNETKVDFIDLKKVTSLSLNEVCERKNTSNGILKNTSHLGLIFRYNQATSIEIPFYNDKEFVELINEYPLIGKWHSRIKALLEIEKRTAVH